METAGVEPAPPRCKRGALPLELHPRVGRTERVRTDGVEPPQREAPRLQRGELSDAQRPQGKEEFGLIKPPSNDDSAADAGFAGVGHPAPDRDRSRAPEGGRPDSNRNLEDHDLGCLPLHHIHHEHEAGTTGLESRYAQR